VIRIVLDVVPVPASRPRVSKWGTYYGKTYKAFRKAMEKELSGWEDPPIAGALIVDVTFHCKTPKKPTKLWPRGDIDNYLKALFDSLNGIVWGDDDQIIMAVGSKVYADNPHIEVIIRPGRDRP